MDNATIKKIEFHFHNYNLDLASLNSRIEDIVHSGMTVNFSHTGKSKYPNTSRVVINHEKIAAIYEEKSWAMVVHNTFIAFRYLKPEIYDVMVAKYVKKKKYNQLISQWISESTLSRWRNEWLECAEAIAKDFKLL